MKLEDIRFQTKCTQPWEKMKGDDRTRFCELCRRNVYDLSSMTRGDAEEFVRRTEGKECVTFYRRVDGTVVTLDCDDWMFMAGRGDRAPEVRDPSAPPPPPPPPGPPPPHPRRTTGSMKAPS